MRERRTYGERRTERKRHTGTGGKPFRRPRRIRARHDHRPDGNPAVELHGRHRAHRLRKLRRHAWLGLIYTVGGILLLMFRRPAPIREFPKKYLIIGGLLFVFYESSISLSLGLASTDASSVEVSLVNYLWPTMMVLLSAGVSHRKHAVVKVLPGAIVATAGVVLAVGGNSGLDWHAAVQHIAANPLPYALAFVGALAWSVYAVFTPAMSHGVDGTSLFFLRGRGVVDYPLRVRAGVAGRAAESGRMAVCVDCRGGDWRWLCLLGLWHSARVYGAAGYCVLCHAGAVHRGQCGVAGFSAVAAVLVWRAAGGRRIGA